VLDILELLARDKRSILFVWDMNIDGKDFLPPISEAGATLFQSPFFKLLHDIQEQRLK
jgi:hypothetical protein